MQTENDKAGLAVKKKKKQKKEEKKERKKKRKEKKKKKRGGGGGGGEKNKHSCIAVLVTVRRLRWILERVIARCGSVLFSADKI